MAMHMSKEMNQKRKERIEELLDFRLSEITDNPVNAYYQSRDLSNLTQALLNITKLIKGEE